MTITYTAGGQTYSCPPIAGSLRTSTPLGNSTVACLVGVGVGSGFQFQIKAGLLTSPLGVDTFSYPQPVLVANSIRATAASAGSTSLLGQYSSGDLVYMTAKHVGSDASLLSLTYTSGVTGSTYSCGSVAIVSTDTAAGTSTISCVTSPGVGSAYHFTVTALNQASLPGADEYNYVQAPSVDEPHAHLSSSPPVSLWLRPLTWLVARARLFVGL